MNKCYGVNMTHVRMEEKLTQHCALSMFDVYFFLPLLAVYFKSFRKMNSAIYMSYI